MSNPRKEAICLIKQATVLPSTSPSTFSMKLSLLLLSLLPLFAQSRHRREYANEEHERSERQYVRRAQLPEVLPTIAGFVQNDVTLSFFVAAVNRVVTGDPVDVAVLNTLFPDLNLAVEDPPPAPPALVVLPQPAAPIQPLPATPIELQPADPLPAVPQPPPVPAPIQPPPAPVPAPIQPQPAPAPIQPQPAPAFQFQPANVPAPIQPQPASVFQFQPANAFSPFVGGGANEVQPANPQGGGPTTVTTNTGCSNGGNFVSITGGSSSFAPGGVGSSATTSNSGGPGVDCGPVPVPVPVPEPAAPAPVPALAPTPLPTTSGARRRLQIRRNNVLQILSEPGDFTFFAPTNNAFVLLSQELLELLYLRDAFIPHLEDLLRYHALNGKRFNDQFFAVEIIPAFNMEGLLVREDPFQVNGIPVVRSNINASNGVTHVINGVLKPDWVDNSILGFVTSTDDLSILFEFLERAGLNDKLDTFRDELTFVAPTNDAFTALGDAVLESLRDPVNQQDLVDILEYHIIIGVFASPELVDGVSLLTEQGGSIEVLIIVSDIIEFKFNQATVVSSDSRDSILANNGVLYRIDAVLNPDSVAGF